ncbi:hypothetical protein OSB04_018325 [Centaurea solstitialis]|uniref:RING-type E3 ubiquitin transferase n=1 Tax=Centaurea solstitialis TaxID=347529 RepID=A0AA38T4K7_9ASTR|nr:hypothetical protein OSB04_018325 [Centaurea solstitialis]
MATATPNSTRVAESGERVPGRKKLFGFLTLKGFGCGRYSSPAVAVRPPDAIPAEKTSRRRRRKKKKNEKKRRRNRGSGLENVVVTVPDVCCTPPGIGFAYDVAENTNADAHRRNHRQVVKIVDGIRSFIRSKVLSKLMEPPWLVQRSRATRQATDLQQPMSTTLADDTAFVRSNVSDARQYNRPHRRSPGISEIVMFEHNPLLDGRLEGSDRFGAWRINADIMSYEELVELSDQIGYVGGGLQEEEILDCLRRPKKSFFKSFDFNSKVKDSKCSICQEECKGDEDLGRLECGHYHHLDCIKQWLLRKNACPICKTVAKPDK